MGAAYSYNAARSGCYGGSAHACGVCGTSEIVLKGRGRNEKGTTVTAVAFQPSGKGFASALGHEDGRVELSIARPPQEARLLLSSSSQQLDVSQGSYQYRPQQVREVVSLHFAGDDSLVVVRSDGKCEVYDDLFSKCFAVGAEKRQNVPPTYVFQAQKMTPQGDAVTSVYACGEEIATGGGDGSVTFWRSAAGQEQLQQEKGDREDHLRSCRNAGRTLVTPNRRGGHEQEGQQERYDTNEDASGSTTAAEDDEDVVDERGRRSRAVLAERYLVGGGDVEAAPRPTPRAGGIGAAPSVTLTRPNAHRGPVTALDFATAVDGTQLVLSGGADGAMRLFRTPTSSSSFSSTTAPPGRFPSRAEVEEYDYIDYSKGAMPLRAVALDKETMIYWNEAPLKSRATAEIPCDRAASITANRLQLWDLQRMRAGFSSVSSSAPQFQHLKFFAKPLFFPPSIGLGAACAAWVATGGQEFVALYDVRISGGGRNGDRTNPVQFYDVPGVTIMNVAHSSTSSGRSVDQFSNSMALHAQSYTGRRYQFDLRMKKVMVTGE